MVHVPVVAGLVPADAQLESATVPPVDAVQVTVRVYDPVQSQVPHAPLDQLYVTVGVEAAHVPVPEQVLNGLALHMMPDAILQFGLEYAEVHDGPHRILHPACVPVPTTPQNLSPLSKHAASIHLPLPQ